MLVFLLKLVKINKSEEYSYYVTKYLMISTKITFELAILWVNNIFSQKS